MAVLVIFRPSAVSTFPYLPLTHFNWDWILLLTSIVNMIWIRIMNEIQKSKSKYENSKIEIKKSKSKNQNSKSKSEM